MQKSAFAIQNKDIQMYEKLHWHYLEIDAFIKVANIGVRTDSRNDIRHNITMLVNHGGNFYTNFLGQISGPSSSCQYHTIGQNLGKETKKYVFKFNQFLIMFCFSVSTPFLII